MYVGVPIHMYVLNSYCFLLICVMSMNLEGRGYFASPLHFLCFNSLYPHPFVSAIKDRQPTVMSLRCTLIIGSDHICVCPEIWPVCLGLWEDWLEATLRNKVTLGFLILLTGVRDSSRMLWYLIYNKTYLFGPDLISGTAPKAIGISWGEI